MRALKLAVLATFFALTMNSNVQAATLKAGVAKVDITPPPGVPMWGYELRSGSGTLDPLFARILILEVGDTRVAFVTLDLGRSIGPASIDEIRKATLKSSGISYVSIMASHAHSGPVVQDVYLEGRPAWEKAAIEKIERGIDQAHQQAIDARIGTGYGVAYIGHNRLKKNIDGSISFFQSNETQIPTAPVDPTVSVVRIDASDGHPLAILINYACHPVIFGPDNRQYSADFPGVMTQTVEQAFEGRPIAFFLQGAPGDINPFYAVVSLQEDPIRWRDWAGKRLGQEAARVAKTIRTEAEANPSLNFVEDSLTFQFRWNEEKFHRAFLASGEIKNEADAKNYLAAYAPPSTQKEQHLRVGTLLINKRIAFMSVPGEAFVDFQIDWRNRCPVQDCLFLGYANGYDGYLPTIRAAVQGGYGANSYTTWIEPGAGERMVDHAVIKIYEMLGMLTDDPK
jgi:neutral ceramidase